MSNRILLHRLLLASTLLLTACQAMQGPPKEIYNTWKINSFTSVENKEFAKNENGGTYLTLLDDNSYVLELDVNVCSGNLNAISERGIIFEPPACTEACCDSPFSKHFMGLLTQISMYKITGNTLRLSVHDWGFIECELVED